MVEIPVFLVEIAKIQLRDEKLKLNTQRVLRYVLVMSLRMLHPIMPHITEKIWQLIPFKLFKDGQKFLMKCDFPTKQDYNYANSVFQMEKTIEAIKGLRNLRQSLNVPAGTQISIKIYGDKDLFEKTQAFIKRMVRVENIEISNETISELPPQCASCVVGDTKIVVPLVGIIDLDKERERQDKKIEKLNKEKNSLMARISNDNFVKNAPQEVITSTKARIDELNQQIASIEELKKIAKDNPVLLLDDVLSELDKERSDNLLKIIDEIGQTFITSVDNKLVSAEALENYQIINLE